jgi:hypothetical protein
MCALRHLGQEVREDVGQGVMLGTEATCGGEGRRRT